MEINRSLWIPMDQLEQQFLHHLQYDKWRQGAILSGFAYCFYVSDLFATLRKNKSGCWVNGFYLEFWVILMILFY